MLLHAAKSQHQQIPPLQPVAVGLVEPSLLLALPPSKAAAAAEEATASPVRRCPSPKGGNKAFAASRASCAALRSRVLELALEPQGSREVQRVLEEVGGTEQGLLVRELQGHVAKALQSPHANHVLQKAIAVMWPSDMFFIIPELLQWGRPSALAKHPYGCRVLERLMEFFPAHWMGAFTADLLDSANELCKHPYGNFVMQHLLEFGGPQQRQQILRVLRSDLVGMATNQNACGVIDKALTYTATDDRCSLVQQVLSHKGLLVQMSMKRWGFATSECLLSLVRGALLDEAHAQLLECTQALQRTVPGRQILEAVHADRAQRGVEAPSVTIATGISGAAPTDVAKVMQKPGNSANAVACVRPEIAGVGISSAKGQNEGATRAAGTNPFPEHPGLVHPARVLILD